MGRCSVLVALSLGAGAVLAASPALAWEPPPSPAAVSVVITNPLEGALFEAPATVQVSGTASISGGTSSGHRDSSKPTLKSLEIAVDGGPAQLIGNATIDPDLPQVSPATVSFSTSVAGVAVGGHQVCVTARGRTGSGSISATDCVGIDVVEDLVNCAVSLCVLSATDEGVATANFAGFGIKKVVGLRAGALQPGECGGLDCVTGFDALFDDVGGGSGIAEMTVVAERNASTPPGLAAVFINGVQVTAKCVGKHPPVPCQKITRTEGGRTKYFVRFAADPGIRFR